MDAAQPYAFASEQWVSDDVSAVSAKKYSRDFLLKFAKQCTDLPKRFEITTDIAEGLMSANIISHVLERDSHSHPFTRIITDRSDAMDRRGSGVMKAGNFGVLGNPRAQTPMQCPMQVIHKAEKYELGIVADEEEGKQRQLEAILNKLTPQNFEMLVEQVIAVNIDNAVALDGLVSQIFEKALMEPTFCEMYANLCLHLSAAFPLSSQYNEKISFKELLVNKCQVEFERGEREKEEANEADEESEEKRAKGRRRVLGNIRLIGELYKKKMLTEWIMHMCIKKLLGSYQDSDEEDVEALCELMGTIGEMIDHPKARMHMDAYFKRMRLLSNNMNLSSKERIMLKDVITLRNNKWKQRRNVEGSMDTAQPDAVGSSVTAKKYSRDFLLKFAGQCTDLPEGFETAAGIAEDLMSAIISDDVIEDDSYLYTGRITYKPGVMIQMQQGASCVIEEDKWRKASSTFRLSSTTTRTYSSTTTRTSPSNPNTTRNRTHSPPQPNLTHQTQPDLEPVTQETQTLEPSSETIPPEPQTILEPLPQPPSTIHSEPSITTGPILKDEIIITSKIASEVVEQLVSKPNSLESDLTQTLLSSPINSLPSENQNQTQTTSLPLATPSVFPVLEKYINQRVQLIEIEKQREMELDIFVHTWIAMEECYFDWHKIYDWFETHNKQQLHINKRLLAAPAWKKSPPPPPAIWEPEPAPIVQEIAPLVPVHSAMVAHSSASAQSSQLDHIEVPKDLLERLVEDNKEFKQFMASSSKRQDELADMLKLLLEKVSKP